MFKKKEKRVKVKKEKKGIFRKKDSLVHNENTDNQNLYINDQILKNQIKNELIKEVNSAFIVNLKAEIKRDLKAELKREIMSQINEEVLKSIKIGLKEKIKKELREELKEEIRKDILLDIQIKEAREKSLREKLAKNNKRREDVKVSVSDEELIRHFLASEDFKEVVAKQKGLENSLVLEIKKDESERRQRLEEKTEEIKINTRKEEVAVTKTEIMVDDRTAQLVLDRTEFDLNSYKDEEMFFEQMQVEATYRDEADESFKESIKAFAREQGGNLKKAGSDIKVISKKGYQISKVELEKIKNSEAFKNYVRKIRELKNKSNTK